MYSYFINKRDKTDRLFINKSDSYRKAFAVARDKVTKEYKQCNIHSLRKELANDYLERRMNEGKSKKEAMYELTYLLGHNRIDVLKYYLK